MDYQQLAGEIVRLSGGKENIVSAVSCMTRLRITVRADDGIREAELKALDGVLGVNHSHPGYVEVVVGGMMRMELKPL